MKYTINNLIELKRFATVLAEQIQPGDVYSLIGDLGAGKTTLVQKIGEAMGLNDYITSPSFSIVNIYGNESNIYHLDLYRLNDPSELESLDFESYFYPEGVSFIEWASKGGDYLPDDMIEIEIEQNANQRQITIRGKDSRADELREALDENFSN